MTEDQLLRAVLDLCGYLGVTTAHFRPARTEHGWRTAVQGDGRGFPDLVLVGGRRLVFRELKSARGQLDPDQRRWRDVLLDAGQDWALWKPGDWPQIQAELKALAKAETPTTCGRPGCYGAGPGYEVRAHTVRCEQCEQCEQTGAGDG